ncbi:MAG TPA: cupredoxin domain-containing protein [Pseudolabrys sp.]|jgi:plastocyanin|uniref:cupredoxin domain-containing protein n=1 Tax=Pseudolabrys sp. TaxID=1960880 RepID=UPI002DDD62AF|nr:cupredoxin domain-containing protein [Pseudolabrys sp.]HEV2627543.1 cupredoxin domain-containing protein [Pseudolabrys sp.]
MRPGRTALLAIALCGFAAVPAQAATIDVVMQNLVVKPVEVTAKVGDTIRWDNKDFVAHTATATDKSFDVMLPPGKTGSTVVTKVGTFDYFCKFHPNMKGKVTVTP